MALDFSGNGGLAVPAKGWLFMEFQISLGNIGHI